MDSPDSFFGVPQHHNKRTHGQMERGHSHHSSLSSPSSPFRLRMNPPNPRPSTESPPQVAERPPLHLPPLQPRYHGDGLDFRRPATTMSTRPEIIDLTSDTEPNSPPALVRHAGSTPFAPHPQQPPVNRASRPPRFDHEIIDLSDEPPHPSARPAIPAQDESPDVQFLRSRPLPSPHGGRGGGTVIPIDVDLLDDLEDDDFEIIAEGRAASAGLRPPRELSSARDFGDMMRFLRRTNGQDLHRGRRRHERIFAERRRRQEQRLGEGGILRFTRAITTARPYPVPPGIDNFVMPDMDFQAIGFDMGLEEERTPSPTSYNPPPPVQEGFTRTPEEGMELVCPNCGDELCAGGTEKKRQVWVIKACGHVYCGECTAARAKSKRKGKEPVSARSKPFKQCLVDGCGKKCSSPQSMIQLFL